MDIILILKIGMAIVAALGFVLAANKTKGSGSAVKVLLLIIMELVIFIALAVGSFWLLDKSFRKVQLTSFSNTFLHASEKLVVQGCVRNVGKYKINNVTLYVKVINNASGGMSLGGGRPNTFEFDMIVAQNLSQGTEKCFKRAVKYPPYFKLANIQRYVTAN